MGGSNSTEEKQVAEQQQAQLNVEKAHLHSLSPTSALLHPKHQSSTSKTVGNLDQQQQKKDSTKNGNQVSTASSNINNSSSSKQQQQQSTTITNEENLKSFISCLRAPPRVPISLNLDPTIAGLMNYGNTCYANSVLQMLFHTPAFRHHITDRHSQQIADLTAKSNGEVPASYLRLYLNIAQKIASTSSANPTNNNQQKMVSLKSFSAPTENEIAVAKKQLTEWKDTVWFELASLFTKITEASEKVSKKAKDELLAAAINNNSETQQQPTVPCPIGNSTIASTIPYKFPVVEPVEMLKKVRNTYFQFNNREQHDAHEFALTLLNTLFEEEAKFLKTSSSNNNNNNNNENDENGSPSSNPGSPIVETPSFSSSSNSPLSSLPPPFSSLIIPNNNQEQQQQIQLNAGNLQTTLRSMTGKTVTLTSCLECDTMTSVKEDLIDVSCVLESRSSLRHNAEAFTTHETLTGENKFTCHCCGSSCVARRRTIVSTPAPKMLLLQIKRFRYSQNGVTKLNDFVPFSDRLRVPVYDAQNNVIGSQLYRLCAFVVHMGSYPMAGHYFCIAHHRTTKQWMVLNDERTSIISERERQKFLGTCPDLFNSDQGNNVTAYVLSYEKDDEFDENFELERIETERREKLRRKQQQQQQQQGEQNHQKGSSNSNNNNNTKTPSATTTNRRYDADVIV